MVWRKSNTVRRQEGTTRSLKCSEREVKRVRSLVPKSDIKCYLSNPSKILNGYGPGVKSLRLSRSPFRSGQCEEYLVGQPGLQKIQKSSKMGIKRKEE